MGRDEPELVVKSAKWNGMRPKPGALRSLRLLADL